MGKTISHTFFYNPQLDVLGQKGRGSEEVKLKLAKYLALIDSAVIKGGVEDYNGDVLQVLASIPGQTALKWSVQFNWSVIVIYIYLKRGKISRHARFLDISCIISYTIIIAATYMSFIVWAVFFFFWHVVPVHPGLWFNLLPLQTSNAGQLHRFPQDCFCRRRDIDTYWLTQVHCRRIEMFHTFSIAASLMKTQVNMFSLQSKMHWMFAERCMCRV